MSDKDDAKCDKALLFLQRRANATREVTAAMVNETRCLESGAQCDLIHLCRKQAF